MVHWSYGKLITCLNYHIVHWSHYALLTWHIDHYSKLIPWYSDHMIQWSHVTLAIMILGYSDHIVHWSHDIGHIAQSLWLCGSLITWYTNDIASWQLVWLHLKKWLNKSKMKNLLHLIILCIHFGLFISSLNIFFILKVP